LNIYTDDINYLKTKICDTNIRIRHKTFEYVDGGICASIAYYILILWSRYHYIFGSFPNLIKYIYDIIKKVKLNNNIPDKPSLEVWKILERGVITLIVFTNSLIKNDIIKDYIQKKQNDDKKKLTISLNKIIHTSSRYINLSQHLSKINVGRSYDS